MTLSLSLLVSLIIWLIFLVILVIVGRWAIAKMGLGEPWPTVLILIVVAIVIAVLANLFLGGGGLIRVGDFAAPSAMLWIT